MIIKYPVNDTRPATSRRWLATKKAASLLAGALCACGAAAEEDELLLAGEDALGTAVQAITNGDLTGETFKAVVKIIEDETGQECTATKIETNKFLTAAHCISSATGNVMGMIADDDGVTGEVTLDIPAGGFRRHPSWDLRNGSNIQDVYDVAVVTTTTSTSTIPIIQNTTSQAPPTIPTIALTAIGYGCDNTSNDDGQRQLGILDLGGGNDHVIRSSGPDATCSGDSGGPYLGTDGKIIGVVDAGNFGVSVFSRTGNIRAWINNPVPGNDSSLFGVGNTLFFMLRKAVSSVPSGLCMVANSNVFQPPNPVSVQIDRCSDGLGKITGKSSGWILLNDSSTPANRFSLMNQATAGCLTPNGSSSGSVLRSVPCTSPIPSSQQWFFTVSSGSLRIKNQSSNLCISTANSGTSAGTNVVQATCDAGTATDSVLSWMATR